MDFGDILERWERGEGGGRGSDGGAGRRAGEDDASRDGPGSARGGAAAREPAGEPLRARASEREGGPGREALKDWLALHGTVDKDAEGGPDNGDPRRAAAAASRRLASLRPEAAIDLHGMTAEEARAALELFLRDAAQRGLEKVLVIHGKGQHSVGEPVLGRTARSVIEASPWAGRFGRADKKDGGGGALWVAIRPFAGAGGRPSGYFSR